MCFGSPNNYCIGKTIFFCGVFSLVSFLCLFNDLRIFVFDSFIGQEASSQVKQVKIISVPEL